jgi:hypothetical protein
MLPRSIGVFKPYYQKGGKRKPARLAKKNTTFQLVFLAGTVFFSRNKSANGS